MMYEQSTMATSSSGGSISQQQQEQCPLPSNLRQQPQLSHLPLTSTTATSASGGSGSSGDLQEQQEKTRFLTFTRVLMKYLKQRDPSMHGLAEAQIKDCYEKNKSGDPQFRSLTTLMKTRLRSTVGELNWKQAETITVDYEHRQISKARRAEEKRSRQHGARGNTAVKSETNPSVKEEEGGDLGGDGVVEEEAGEITYTKYKPAKFGCGKDHPDPVVENSTLAAVIPPDIEFDLAMPPSIIYDGLLSNLQLEAIAYGCRRHEINLPSKPIEERNWMTHSMNEDVKIDVKVDDSLGTSFPDVGGGRKRDPVALRAGFLLGDGAGMGKGRTLAGFVVENIARGRKKHVWISVSSDLYEDAKRDLSDLGLTTYANKHCYNLGKLPGDLEETCSEGVMFATYQTLISKNKAKQTRLDQLIEWCGGDEFQGLIMLDECHKAVSPCCCCCQAYFYSHRSIIPLILYCYTCSSYFKHNTASYRKR
jgi:hypothetical protein